MGTPTAEEAVLRVSVKGRGLVRGYHNENSLALNLFNGLRI